MANEKHLEFIQQIINRYNSNSFIIKGWTITIVSAILALAGTVKEPRLIPIAIIPIILFWFIDTYYLSNERCFVDLYNATISETYNLPLQSISKKDFVPNDKNSEILKVKNFELNFKLFKIYKDNDFYTVLFSKTIFWFYMLLLALTLSTWFFYSNSFNKNDDETKQEIKNNCHQQGIGKSRADSTKLIISNPIKH